MYTLYIYIHTIVHIYYILYYKLNVVYIYTIYSICSIYILYIVYVVYTILYIYTRQYYSALKSKGSFGSRWWSAKTCTHLLLQEHQNFNQLLNNHRQEDTGAHQKDNPCPRAKEKSQWGGRRSTIMIKSNLIPTGWVTNKLKNSNTKEGLALLWRF